MIATLPPITEILEKGSLIKKFDIPFANGGEAHLYSYKEDASSNEWTITLIKKPDGSYDYLMTTDIQDFLTKSLDLAKNLSKIIVK